MKTTATRKQDEAPGRPAPALKTPQSIVHIKHCITLRQYKYWVLLLQELRAKYEARATPDEDGFFSISLEHIAEKMGYVPTKAELRADLETIRKEPISFNVLSKDGQKELYGAGFISEYFVSTNRIRFKFPSFLEKVMKGLDEPQTIFSLINWSIFNHFSGKYEAIIYKLCKDYLNSPGGRTPYMELEQFREYMGVRSEEYPEFKEFNRRVISGPVANINKNDISDISVESVFCKNGRSVVGLYFAVTSKKQSILPFTEIDAANVFRFAKVPITPKLQQEYLAIRPQEEIMLCIERANAYAEELQLSGKIAKYGAIYRKAITEGWHRDGVGVKPLLKRAVTIKKNEAQTLAGIQDDWEKSQRQQDENARAWAEFEAMAEGKKQSLQDDFLKQASKEEIKIFEKSGRNIGPFRVFVRKKILDHRK